MVYLVQSIRKRLRELNIATIRKRKVSFYSVTNVSMSLSMCTHLCVFKADHIQRFGVCAHSLGYH